MISQYRAITDLSVYPELLKTAASLPHLSSLISRDRVSQFLLNAPQLSFSYVGACVTEPLLDLFQKASDELGLRSQFQQVLAGDIMNFSESRSVRHHQTRSQVDAGWYGQERERVFAFATQARTQFKQVLHIGIGGSDLGPRAMYEALRRYVAVSGDEILPVHFVSNLDPDDLLSVVSHLSLKDTLIVLASKSGTTLETTMNWTLLTEIAQAQGISLDQLVKSTVTVTCKGAILDDPKRYREVFYIDEAIGGRFSLTSAIGAVGLSCAFGPEIFRRFLAGAAQMDAHAQNADVTQNAPLLNAWIGVWERQFLGYSSKAIVPYAQPLSLFVSHLQQLECESNGKSVDRNGQSISYPTCPVIWGGLGSISQHSFFQWLHQGSHDSSIQLIGSYESQFTCPQSHEALNRNLAAQLMAFIRGDAHPESPQRHCDGNRSTTLVMLKDLSPESCGALLSFYENTVMFQGFIWNINSFDQEAVQLGKRLAVQLETGESDPMLNAIYSLVRSR